MDCTTLDLGIGRPDDANLPLAELCKALEHRTALDDRTCLQYGPDPGSESFRHILGDFLTRHYGVHVLPERLLITAGASHGLDLVLSRLTQAGDTICVEDPTYFLALKIFEGRRLRVMPLPTDAEGLDVAAAEALLRRERPALVYTIPAYHNPTGMTLSAARRERLVRLAREIGFVIVADEVYHVLGDAGEIPPPLASFGEEQVISLGSFSKILGPGLRLGWIECVPTQMKNLLTCGVIASGGGFNPFVSAIVESAMTLGIQDECLRKFKKIYNRRRVHMIGLLQAMLPKEVRFVSPAGGYFIWLQLPRTLDARDLRKAAVAKGVDFKPGPLFSCEGHFPNYLRVCCTFLDEDQLEQACQRLAAVLQAALTKA